MENEVSQEPARRPLWFRLIVGGNPKLTLARIVISIGAAFILMKWIVAPIRVTGNSMSPTYQNGQINVVNRLAYSRTPPERGDIVAVEFAGQKVLLLKRIVALPGEMVYVNNGKIYVNHEPLDEPYANGKIPWKIPPSKLESNQYMVIGDNRPDSSFHFTYDFKIVGKVLF